MEEIIKAANSLLNGKRKYDMTHQELNLAYKMRAMGYGEWVQVGLAGRTGVGPIYEAKAEPKMK